MQKNFDFSTGQLSEESQRELASEGAEPVARDLCFDREFGSSTFTMGKWLRLNLSGLVDSLSSKPAIHLSFRMECLVNRPYSDIIVRKVYCIGQADLLDSRFARLASKPADLANRLTRT